VLNLSVESNVLELSSVGIRLVPPGVDERSEEENGEQEELDYGDETNYRDENNDGAAQPEDPSGEIENPSNVNEEDGNTSTAITGSGEEDLKVGFALPRTNESADTYKMRFNITEIDIGTDAPNDGFGFSLVNSDGDGLTDRRQLEKGDVTYNFSHDENQNISQNHDDLILIIDSVTTDRSTHTLDINFFELIAE